MKENVWFFMILFLLIVFSLWAIVVVGDAGADETYEVYTPVQFTSIWADDARCIYYPKMKPPCPTWDTGAPLP